VVISCRKSRLLGYLLALVVCLSTLVGCQTIKTHPVMAEHMIALNREGEAFPINQVPGKDSRERLQYSMKKITDSLRNEIEQGNDVEIVMYIHGGMINKFQSASSAEKILSKIEKENAISRSTKRSVVFPIFINWESAMMPSYLNHLLVIRQGKEARVLGLLSSPLYLAADLGRAAARLPITYSYQGYLAVQSAHAPSFSEIAYDNLLFDPSSAQSRAPRIFLGENTLTGIDKLTDKLTYIFPGFLKLASTPLLDVIGKEAYADMLRRTKTAFTSPSDFASNEEKMELCKARVLKNPADICDAFNKDPTGGVTVLLEALAQFKDDQDCTCAHKGHGKVTVTLIGHSMGSFLASEILKRSEQSEGRYLQVDNIVFMAAAASVKEFQDSVVPYLQRHEAARFYNLTLHPWAEENDKEYWDVVPRGSLLVWIDTYATAPETMSDFTVGQFNNALKALEFVPREVRSRITLKGFGVNDCTNQGKGRPRKHGDFNDADLGFWRHEFWNIPGAGCSRE
jgi:hypothetical protein